MTYDDLQQAYVAHRREHGRKSTAAILAEFDADALDEIPELKWAEVHRRLSAGKHAKSASAKLDTREIWNRFNRREFDFG